jgi:hypothetical protein
MSHRRSASSVRTVACCGRAWSLPGRCAASAHLHQYEGTSARAGTTVSGLGQWVFHNGTQVQQHVQINIERLDSDHMGFENVEDDPSDNDDIPPPHFIHRIITLPSSKLDNYESQYDSFREEFVHTSVSHSRVTLMVLGYCCVL